ncbi:MAG: 1-deoxy-D-xylulose-5-phosphate reductoisomerase [Planctomycetota bacterium]
MATTVAILGATGSVGRQAIDVLAAMPGRFQVVALSAWSNWEGLLAAARTVGTKALALVKECPGSIETPAGTRLFTGETAVSRMLEETAPEFVFVAIAGAAGLPATLSAISVARRVALANKESLVIAGDLVTTQAAKRGTELIPVDSEHSGIFQILDGRSPQEVRHVYLTASGGPFLGYPPERLEHVSPQEALTHPTWRMGEKISIDSATLMNKALEVLEARCLFNLQAHQIKVLIHPESIMHSMVEFVDGSVIAQLAVPDMRLPIRYALTYPERQRHEATKLDLSRMAALHFRQPDPGEFPALDLGFEVAKTGGTSAAVLNAANEIAVAHFLKGAIRFPRIVELTRAVLDKHRSGPVTDLETLFEADRWARKEATNWLSCKA